MAVTINAKGTSVPYFQIGKNGVALYQGLSDPSLAYTIRDGDYWFDSTTGGIKTWETDAWLAPKLNQLTFPTNTGSSGQVLITDGSGNLSFSTVSGTGSVTSVSVVTANGISGTVDTPNSTPAITLTLGNITPSSVAVGGALHTSFSGDPIATLVGGTTTGALVQSPNIAHYVVQLRSNDDSDSFAVVANSSATASDPPDKLAFRVRRTGDATFGGVVTTGLGTALLPAYSFNGDTNTGMWSPEAETIAFSTAGTEMMRQTTDGTTFQGKVAFNDALATATTVSVGGTAPLNATSRGLRVISNLTGVAGSASWASYLSQPTCAADAVVSSLAHMQANQGTFTSGASVTSQIGFAASSTLTGATSNYGFKGDIAAGTDRWNVYMGGTAQNYFAGNVGIGSGKTEPATALDVNGTVTATEISVDSLSIGTTINIDDDTFVTTSTTPNQVAAIVSSVVYRSVKYMIQASTDSEYQMTEINVIHNGTDAFSTEYGTVLSGNRLATFSVDLSGNSLRLLVTPETSASTTFKLIRTAIAL